MHGQKSNHNARSDISQKQSSGSIHAENDALFSTLYYAFHILSQYEKQAEKTDSIIM